MNSLLNKILPKALGLGINLSSYVMPQWAIDKTFTLFGTPRVGKIRPSDKAFLDTCESSDRFDTQYGSIKYYIWNKKGARTILLLHGWESNAARWRSLIKYLLKDDFCVIALDAPAHGDSSNDLCDMIQYIAAIDKAVTNFAPNVIAGHSLGGASLGYYLSEYKFPEFTKLIFMGSPTELTKMVDSFTDILGLSKRVIRLLNQRFIEKFGFAVDSISAAKFVKEVEIPTLIIHDLQDKVIPVHNAEIYHKLMRNSKILITDGHGHRLQHKVVFKGIMNFLNEEVNQETV